jgi:hypothetical protein
MWQEPTGKVTDKASTPNKIPRPNMLFEYARRLDATARQCQKGKVRQFSFFSALKTSRSSTQHVKRKRISEHARVLILNSYSASKSEIE